MLGFLIIIRIQKFIQGSRLKFIMWSLLLLTHHPLLHKRRLALVKLLRILWHIFEIACWRDLIVFFLTAVT